MSYRLGVDLGTTFTAAATITDGTPPVMLGLGNRALEIPSVLFIPADGDPVVGEPAERRGLHDPDRMVREFKRRFGDDVPILVAGAPYSADALTARLLRSVVDTAEERLGARPDLVAISHPANWGPYKLDLLDQVAVMAGLEGAVRCTEPEAAAAQYEAHAAVAVGRRLLVYDLGGGTFDVCVLEKSEGGFRVLGTPGGVEHVGGVDFNAAVLQHVWRSVKDSASAVNSGDPEVSAALARLHRDCVEAKEALSSEVDVQIPVTLPGITTSVRLTRSEFEEMIRPMLLETLGAVRRVLQSAAIQPRDLATVILVGGSSRIPLVSEMLQTELAVPTAVDLHPKHDVALGAARAAQRVTDGAPAPTLLLPPPAAPAAHPPASPRPARRRPPPPVSLAVVKPSPAVVGPVVGEQLPDEDGDDEAEGSDAKRRALIVAAALVVAVVLILAISSLVRPDDVPTGSGTPVASVSETPTAPPPQVQSFRGGSYTWADGVTMKLRMRLVERWGVKHPYCEDSPCGVAAANDLHVVFAYAVTAPKGFKGSINPAACPGILKGAKAADNKSVRLLKNLSQPIPKSSAARATGSGVAHYSIDASAKSHSFRLESTCGDTEHTNEVGVFGGKLGAPRNEHSPGQVGDKVKETQFGYYKLRADQVRTDVGGRTYAVLVEKCGLKKVPKTGLPPASALSSWSLSTSAETLEPIRKKFAALVPSYPYGSGGKGSCSSGWLAFRLVSNAKVTSITYKNRLEEPVVWVIAKTPIPPANPTPTPSRGTGTGPGQERPTPKPTTTKPRTPSPEPSASGTPR